MSVLKNKHIEIFVEYLKLHNQVDFCLDTFPYTGGTTTMHALWMGVPTLTLIGDTYPSAQGGAVNNRAGLSQYFIADSQAEFVAKALFLAENKDILKNMKYSLRAHMVENYAGNLEALLNGFDKSVSIAWGKWCKNEKLMNFEIKPEDIFYKEENTFIQRH